MTSLLATIVLAQANLDSKVSLEMKDALASEVVAEIGKKAHIACKYVDDNLKVSVFAKGVPARVLLERIGDTLGYKPIVEGDSYRFLVSEERRAQNLYLDSEALFRNTIISSRLEALSKLTFQPYSPIARKVSETPASEVEPADAWAAKHIARPAYYALGMAYRLSATETGADQTHPYELHMPGIAMGTYSSYAFGVEPPVHQQVAQTYADENSSAIRGTIIAYGVLNSTAEIKVSVIEGQHDTPDPLIKAPFLFAKPPAALQNTKFAKALAAWNTDVRDLPADLLKATYSQGPSPHSDYFDDRISLSDKLETLYRATGVPIVATSFRTPALEQEPREVDSTASALENLVTSEKCFLHFEKGVLQVRHPAYWLLECSEPSEIVVRSIEKIAKSRAPTLSEYGYLAVSLGQKIDSGAFRPFGALYRCPHSYDRLLNQRGCLFRFDGGPLATAFPGLYFFGSLPAEQQKALLAGAAWWSQPGGITMTFGIRGQITSYRTSADRSPIPDRIANAGPVFDAAMSSAYLTGVERGVNIARQAQTLYPYALDDPRMPLIQLTVQLTDRAEYIWLEGSGPTYVFKVGFGPEKVTAAFPLTIAWHERS